MAINAGTVFVNVAANIGPFRQQMLGLGSQISATGAAISRFGVSLSRAVTLPLALAGGAATKLALDYNSAFTRIRAITNQSEKDIAQWSDRVLEMAGKTAQAPQELAEGLYFVASAGLKVSQIMPVMQASAKAAAVGLGSVGTVARLVTNAVNAFESTNLTAAHAVDVLVAAVREGTAEPQEFAEAMGRILPFASKAHVEFDNIAASLAVLSNIGLDVNEGVTALRGLLKSITVPGTQAADTLKKIGLEAQDVRDILAKGGFLAAVRELEERTKKKFGQGWLDAMNKIIPNIRALTGGLGLTVQEADRVDGVFRRVEGTTGDLNKAFEETRKGAAFQFQQSLAKLKAVGIAIGNELIPVLLEAAKAITTFFEAFNTLDDSTKKFLIRIGLIAVALGPFIRLIGLGYGAIGALHIAFGRLASVGARLGGVLTGLPALFGGSARAAAAAATEANRAAAGVTYVGGAWRNAAGQFAKAPEVVTATSIALQRLKGVAVAAGAALLRLGGGLASIGAAVAGFAVVNRVVDDLAVTEGELSKQTGITVDNINALYGQLNNTTAIFNPFITREDKARQAGEIFNEILKDMVKSGDSVAYAQDRLNEIFQDSIHDIGGLSASMDTLEQNLRGRLGLLETGDAVTLLKRRFDELLGSLEVVRTRGGDIVSQTFNPENVQEFIAALISVHDSGLSVAEIFGGPLRAAVRAGTTDWAHITNWFERAGLAMPYAQAGKLADEIFLASGATHEQRQALAQSLGVLDDFNIKMAKSTEIMVGSRIAAGDMDGAMKVLNRTIGEEAVDAVLEHLDTLTNEQLAWINDKLAAGDYLDVLQRIEAIERRRRQRERREARAPGGGDFLTAGAGAVIREQIKAVEDLLRTEPKLKSWGETLRGAAQFKPEDFRGISDLVSRLGDAGIKWNDLSQKMRHKLTASIEAGNARETILTLLRLLEKYEKQHTTKADAETKGAQNKIETLTHKANQIPKQVTTNVTVNASSAMSTVDRLKERLTDVTYKSWVATVRVETTGGSTGFELIEELTEALEEITTHPWKTVVQVTAEGIRDVGRKYAEATKLLEKLGQVAQEVFGLEFPKAYQEDVKAFKEATQEKSKDLERQLRDAQKGFDKLKDRVNSFRDAIRSGFADASELVGGAVEGLQAAADYAKQYAEDLLSEEGPTGPPPMPFDLQNYLAEQLAQAKDFALKLGQLAAAGLAPAILAELAQGGQQSLPLIDALLAGGKDLISEFNTAQQTINQFANATADALSEEKFGGAIKRARERINHLSERIDNFNERIAHQIENFVQALQARRVSDSIETLIHALNQATGRLGGNVPHAAHGAIVRRPTLLMAGEAGPEAITPLNGYKHGGDVNVYLTVKGNAIYAQDLADEVRAILLRDKRHKGNLGLS